ncbi:outer membrane lipoprotein carrier protein LolA [candidate division KSB3 bacterium]|uniref:Outer-membrane lipoprotein carrier protein n=1 Tax=candidate division KSB3 bacterium TaxID=2044937 RepID=A0A2G6E7H8_9BACT|nr:MAG: outer membrane lipoprotein carrier protein LolA [candidate division KSB3 bacterium]PIE30268.1 MAG: outer membrane lipoprotein carrier protein LolA [candidate division KSB3 bacterium]
MKFFHLIILILGSFLCSSFSMPAQAADLALEQIIDSVQAEYERTSDIYASFSQVSKLRSLPTPKKSQGIVYFKKPGKMRWEYTNPDQQLLVSNGKTMWFYVAEDAQVIIQNADDAYGSRTPVTFLAGMGKLQNDFHMKLLSAASDAEYSLELLPKQPQPELAKLILTVDAVTFRVIHTAVYDPYGNITDVYLDNITTEMNPPDELFNFEIPEGVDVIRQN